MLNKTFVFSNAVSHRLLKNKNKNIRFAMEEILGKEKHKTWISLDCKTVGFFLKISKEIGKA